MTRYRATLAYDGSAYYGYQIQPAVPTVQGELQATLEHLFDEPVTVWAAGRTDTGVHATGQVIAFEAAWKHDAPTLLKAINANLPDDIALQSIVAHDDFHPRFDALSRTYRYRVLRTDIRQPLLNRRAWQVHQPLDENTMQQAAALLVGEHDFAAFGNPPQGNNTVRQMMRSGWQVTPAPDAHSGQMFLYEVEATAFLQHMVRRLVGMQVAVGRGLLSVTEFQAIFESRDLARSQWLAPPQGLTLTYVRYPS
jgi:tRNA pseudouridine38-40 synthase